MRKEISPRCSSVTHTINFNFKTRPNVLLFQDNKTEHTVCSNPPDDGTPHSLPSLLLRKLFTQSWRLEEVTFNKAFNHL